MSLANADLEKCESCGHLIARGRLTCGNCGAAASRIVSIGDYNYYLRVPSWGLRVASETLTRLYQRAKNVDRFFTGNDIIGEIHVSDFVEFFKMMTFDIECSDDYEVYNRQWKEGLQLYRIYVTISKDVSIYRFIAILDGTITVCEINQDATADIDERLKIKNRQDEKERKEEWTKEVDEITDKLESKRSDLKEINSKIKEINEAFDRMSFLDKRKHQNDGFEFLAKKGKLEKEIKAIEDRIDFIKRNCLINYL